MSVDYASYLQNESIRQAANDRATQQYNAAKLAGESEQNALARAKFEWEKTYQEAGLTGYYQGSPTMGTQQWWANAFGTWATPTAGQETMAREQQTFGQQQALANLYGQAYGGFGNVPQGQQTLAAQQQQFSQGLQTQQEQRAAQAQQQSQAQAYLNLLSNLRGPADWAKYQQVLGATPGGMRDLVAAAMGQYVPGGGATTGMQPEAASLESLMGQVSGQGYGGPGGGQLTMPNVYTGGQGSYGQQAGGPLSPSYSQSPMAQQPGAVPAAGPPQPIRLGTGTVQAIPGTANSYQWTPEDAYWTPSGQATLAQLQAQQTNPQQVSWNPQQPNWRQQGALQEPNRQTAQQYTQQSRLPNAAGNGTNTMGGQQNQYNLPAPNQIAAQSWNNLAPSQKEMMLGNYEAAGWSKPDVEALMNQALPKYASNAATAGTWRLR